jgi:deoxyribodipyrimidine photolyase-related protein
VNREQSLQLLDFFRGVLALFGSYQDAMSPNEWFISCENFIFYEYKMISPQEVIASNTGMGKET